MGWVDFNDLISYKDNKEERIFAVFSSFLRWD